MKDDYPGWDIIKSLMQTIKEIVLAWQEWMKYIEFGLCYSLTITRP